MPLLDLSQTTVAIQRLLQFNIPLLEPALAGTLTISTLRPEMVVGGANVLSLYCYHVAPDGANRYRPRQPGGPRPIATSPLSLNLTYIVTAHTVVGTDFDALAEQRLLGYAMKTLHDFPVIDDTTRVDGQIVMPDEIRGQANVFNIVQLQLTAGEALNYWANETQTTVKPSAYYEVNAAELQPEPPARLPGVVLQIGSFVFPKDTPAIAGTSAEVAYARPPGQGGGAATLTASPARVGPVTAVPPPANVMRLSGRAFTAGDAGRLFLAHPLWARTFPGGRVAVDPALNGALGWQVAAAADRVEVTLGNALRAVPPGGGAAVDLPLYPGIYLADWEITRRFDTGGATQALAERSNASAVMVCPRILGALRDGATGRVTLDFGGDWLLTRGRPAPPDPTTAPELDILLSVDGRTYALAAGALPALPGTFTLADHALTYAPWPEADAPGDHAIRVVVDGADSQPFWVTVP